VYFLCQRHMHPPNAQPLQIEHELVSNEGAGLHTKGLNGYRTVSPLGLHVLRSRLQLLQALRYRAHRRQLLCTPSLKVLDFRPQLLHLLTTCARRTTKRAHHKHHACMASMASTLSLRVGTV